MKRLERHQLGPQLHATGQRTGWHQHACGRHAVAIAKAEEAARAQPQTPCSSHAVSRSFGTIAWPRSLISSPSGARMNPIVRRPCQRNAMHVVAFG
jgi:hypothetical protein